MIKKFRSKQHEIEAIQFTEKNKPEVVRFFGGDRDLFYFSHFGERLFLKRINGDREVQKGEWITKNKSGSYYVLDRSSLDADFEEI